MKAIKSNKGEHKKLFIVATPIGNLNDMTYRAVQTLEEVDYILAEDTRETQKLLNHFDIKGKLISYHKFSEQKVVDQLDNLEFSSIALVSDAGTPVVSDPGSRVVDYFIANDFVVTPIPGPVAAIAGYIGSGIFNQDGTFMFVGFLKGKNNSQKVTQLEEYKNLCAPLIIYTTPKKLKGDLEAINDSLGDQRVSIAREITKLNEEFIRGSVSEVLANMDELTLKGEMVLVVENIANVEELSDEAVIKLVEEKEVNMSRSQAIKEVAKENKLSKNHVYDLMTRR